jgi:hypothetical protein
MLRRPVRVFAPRSRFGGFGPPEVITVVVREYLRYRDVFRDCGLGGDLAKAMAPPRTDLVSRVGEAAGQRAAGGFATTRACTARSAVEVRAISAISADEKEATHSLLGGVDRQRVTSERTPIVV